MTHIWVSTWWFYILLVWCIKIIIQCGCSCTAAFDGMILLYIVMHNMYICTFWILSWKLEYRCCNFIENCWENIVKFKRVGADGFSYRWARDERDVICEISRIDEQRWVNGKMFALNKIYCHMLELLYSG